MTNNIPATKINLPRDRATCNAWARSFYTFDPDINRIINQHALFITSAYEIIDGNCKDTDDFCKQQLKDLGFPSLIETIIREYFMIGEVFLYLNLYEKTVQIQNPDYVFIKRASNGGEQVFLRPDENLRRICFSKKIEDIEIRDSIPESIIETVKAGKNILMNPLQLWYFSNKISPYDLRGSSFIFPLFITIKQLGTPIKSEENKQTIRQTLFDITSSDQITKDILFTKYVIIIESLEYWFNHKVLEQIAKFQNLKGKLPQIRFNKTKLKNKLDIVKTTSTL